MYTRHLTVAALLAVGAALGGCAQSQDAMDSIQNAVHDFNPLGTAKKPLPGQRRALFPEGVPGVQQGVPEELIKGHHQVAETPEPVVEPKPAKPKAQSRRARTSRTATAAPAAAPAQRKRAPRRPSAVASQEPPADAVWPSPPAQPRRAAPAPAAPAQARRATPPPAPAQASRAPARAATPAPAQGWAPPTSTTVPTAWPDPPR